MRTKHTSLVVAVGLVACGGSAPDSTLYYVQDGQLHVWPESAEARLLSPPGAHLSPDGSRWLDGSFYELTLHDGDSGESTLVAEGDAGEEIIPESVVWSPDGRRFAYLQFGLEGYRVRIVTLEGLEGQAVELSAGHAGGQLAWLDAARLVYSDFDRLFAYNLETDETLDLGEGRLPVPSPDVAHVAFERVSDVARSGCATAVGAGVVDADGDNWRVVLDEAERFASVVGWTEGGDALLVLSRPIDCNAPNPPPPDRLLRIDLAEGGIETLSTRADGPWPLALLAADPLTDRVAFVEPACDPTGETSVTQRLVVSAASRPDQREIVAETESPGCAFARLRWLPPPVGRP